jgi:hypothetical protein
MITIEYAISNETTNKNPGAEKNKNPFDDIEI